MATSLRQLGFWRLASALVAFALSGCGGGGAPAPSVVPPPISVSLSTAVATVQVGGTAKLTATVTNDSSASGVAWAVTCSAAECGEISPTKTATGMATTYTAPSSVPSNNLTITITATSVSDTSKKSSATIVPVGHIAGYDVGVDYHAYGLDINQTGFIAIYNQPTVRQTVQAQLQGMADRGASFILTFIWFAKEPGNDCCSTAQVTFPMTEQEQANLRAYAQDVASVVSASGSRLRLGIGCAWLGAADYTVGSPTTTLGASKLSATEFVSRVQAATDELLAAVSDVSRPDGVRVVETIWFDGSIAIPGPGESGGNPNEGWFLTANYPRFISAASQHGMTPSILFAADGAQSIVLNDSYVDALYPILDGHGSMFWTYRGVKFMVDNGLPLPPRVEFDCYLDPPGAPYGQILQRVLDDADAVLPSLGAPRLYGCSEAYYLADPNQRYLYGQAFPAQAALNSRLQRVSFWTTPGGGVNNEEQNSTYPFSIEDFLPPPVP